MLGRIFLPLKRLARQAFAGLVARLGVARWVEDALDMPAAGQHKLHLAAKQLRRLVAGLPRRDVIVGAGQGVDIGGDLLEVDGRAAHFQGVGAYQWVVLEQFDQVAMERCRQACGVVVPEQDVEHRWLVAQQVIIDPVVPDQVVGAHPGEYLGHVAALQHACLVRMALGRFQRLLVHKQRHLGIQGSVQHAYQQGQGVDLLLSQRRVVAQQRRAGDATGAGSEHIHVFATGNRRDHIDRFLERLDIGRQPPFALGLGGVAPTDDKSLLPIAQAEARQALIRAQVEYIEFVDLRWHYQQWALVYLLGDGLVLDQLQHIVAKHHRAFAGAQGLADFKGAHVDLAGHAAVVHHVLGQVGQAIEQAFTAGFKEAFDRRRVGRAVGGGHGFGHQVDHEVAAADVVCRQVAVVDPVVKFLAPRQVSLQITFVERVLAPGRVVEATVVALGYQWGFAEHHILQFDAKMGDVLDAVQRLLDGLGQHHPGRGQ